MKTTSQVFVVVAEEGYWGKGKTLAEAASGCHKAGAAKSSKRLVSRCYVGAETSLQEVTVTGGGEISFPPDLTSVRLFGPFTAISIGQLMRDKEP